MKKSASILACAFSLFAISFTANAASLSYTCKVKRIYDLSDNGTLETSSFEKTMKGSSFSVSKVTGEIIGQVMPTLNADSTRVIHSGSNEYSFKSVADFGNQFQIIEIQEFKKGENKPFVASSMGGAGIVTGLCE